MAVYSGGITSVGAGTIVTNAGSALVTVTPNASTTRGDLLVVLCYAGGNAIGAVDAGDGWVIPPGSIGYNAAGYSVFLAMCIAKGSSGYAGITLPSSMAWTADTCTFRITSMPYGMIYKWDIGMAASYCDWYNATSSAVTLTTPIRTSPPGQYLEIHGRGYNNGGTTTTVSPPAGYTEIFDTGQVSPAHGIEISYFPWGAGTTRASVNGNLAVAKTNRGVVVAMVPIIAPTMDHRSMRRRSIA